MSDPHIYSEEEIELFLKGDRREIDKLLLTSCNSIASVFLTFRDTEFRPHATEEQKMFDALGTPEEVDLRRRWLDSQIKKEMKRDEIRDKILNSATVWAVPIALAALLGVMQEGVREKMSKWIAPAQQEQKK